MPEVAAAGRRKMWQAAASLLAATVAVATTGFAATLPVQAEGAAAEFSPHARRTLHLVFSKEPVWASGLETGRVAVRSFSDPQFVLTAGLKGGLEMAARPMPRLPDTSRPGWSSLPHEEEAYPNGDAIRSDHVDPFTISAGNLVITASPLPPAASNDLPTDMQRKFLSGAFNTYPFCQTYGTFEVVAKVPAGRGLWPAIWLLPADDSWPPEIDAPEVLGDDASVAYYSIHTKDRAWVARQRGSYARSVTTDRAQAHVDLSSGFHRYGVDWEADTITFYLDDREVARRSTPADMHKPFYLIINLAVGGVGSWPGPPSKATPLPASLLIKSVDVWSARPRYQDRQDPFEERSEPAALR